MTNRQSDLALLAIFEPPDKNAIDSDSKGIFAHTKYGDMLTNDLD